LTAAPPGVRGSLPTSAPVTSAVRDVGYHVKTGRFHYWRTDLSLAHSDRPIRRRVVETEEPQDEVVLASLHTQGRATCNLIVKCPEKFFSEKYGADMSSARLNLRGVHLCDEGARCMPRNRLEIGLPTLVSYRAGLGAFSPAENKKNRLRAGMPAKDFLDGGTGFVAEEEGQPRQVAAVAGGSGRLPEGACGTDGRSKSPSSTSRTCRAPCILDAVLEESAGMVYTYN